MLAFSLSPFFACICFVYASLVLLKMPLKQEALHYIYRHLGNKYTIQHFKSGIVVALIGFIISYAPQQLLACKLEEAKMMDKST